MLKSRFLRLAERMNIHTIASFLSSASSRSLVATEDGNRGQAYRRSEILRHNSSPFREYTRPLVATKSTNASELSLFLRESTCTPARFCPSFGTDIEVAGSLSFSNLLTTSIRRTGQYAWSLTITRHIFRSKKSTKSQLCSSGSTKWTKWHQLDHIEFIERTTRPCVRGEATGL